MSTLDPSLRATPDAGTRAHPGHAIAGPLVRLLAAVALASAAAGGLATLALERLIAAMEPPRLVPAKTSALDAPTTPDVPAATATTATTAATATTADRASGPPATPVVNDVLRDTAEPPIEPPPAS